MINRIRKLIFRKARAISLILKLMALPDEYFYEAYRLMYNERESRIAKMYPDCYKPTYWGRF